MTYQNIVIQSIEIYHPETIVDNEFFLEHFSKMNQDPSAFLNEMGKKYRYIDTDQNENSLSLAIKACKKVLSSSRIPESKIDMIVFVSDTPEYLIPTNALLIKEAIHATSAMIVYDHNSNCIGMISAIDQVSHYMKGNHRIKRALVVGALHTETMVNKKCLLSYPTFGDGSCAIILEKIEEHTQRGVIDTVYYTVSEYCDKMIFPSKGLSKLTDQNNSKLIWEAHNVDFFIDIWETLLVKLLKENRISSEKIKQYFFSQISIRNIEAIVNRLHLETDTAPYYGDKYGYTGCSSPFFAFYEFLKGQKEAPSNNNVIFCSVGAGYTMAAMLYKF